MKRKAQEEIVGFVLIMLLVVVILLIILGISVRKGGGEERIESRGIYQFLGSLMQYTTDCTLSTGGGFLDVNRMVGECYVNPNQKCLSNKEVCTVLNETVNGLIDTGWKVGPERDIKGYIFIVEIGDDEALRLESGECSGNSARMSEFLSAGRTETETTTLELCY